MGLIPHQCNNCARRINGRCVSLEVFDKSGKCEMYTTDYKEVIKMYDDMISYSQKKNGFNASNYSIKKERDEIIRRYNYKIRKGVII